MGRGISREVYRWYLSLIWFSINLYWDYAMKINIFKDLFDKCSPFPTKHPTCFLFGWPLNYKMPHDSIDGMNQNENLCQFNNLRHCLRCLKCDTCPFNSFTTCKNRPLLGLIVYHRWHFSWETQRRRFPRSNHITFRYTFFYHFSSILMKMMIDNNNKDMRHICT